MLISLTIDRTTDIFGFFMQIKERYSEVIDYRILIDFAQNHLHLEIDLNEANSAFVMTKMADICRVAGEHKFIGVQIHED